MIITKVLMICRLAHHREPALSNLGFKVGVHARLMSWPSVFSMEWAVTSTAANLAQLNENVVDEYGNDETKTFL